MYAYNHPLSGVTVRAVHVLVAFDRAIRMATSRGRPADLALWTEERGLITERILTKG